MKLDLACHTNAVLPSVADPRWRATVAGLAEIGYARVVLPFLGGTPGAADLVAECRAHGLDAIAMCRQAADRDVSSSDPMTAEAGETWLCEQIDQAAQLGIDHITGLAYGLFGPAIGPVGRDAFERTARRVGRAADYARERGVLLTCEILNRYETAFMNTVEQGVQFVEASGSEAVKLHVDTFHMAIEERDSATAIVAALPHVAYIELGQSGRGMLSQGVVPIADLVRDVLGAGYAGRWGVEAFSSRILHEPSAAALSIWRAPYDDGLALAADAMTVIGEGVSAAERGGGR